MQQTTTPAESAQPMFNVPSSALSEVENFFAETSLYSQAEARSTAVASASLGLGVSSALLAGSSLLSSSEGLTSMTAHRREALRGCICILLGGAAGMGFGILRTGGIATSAPAWLQFKKMLKQADPARGFK